MFRWSDAGIFDAMETVAGRDPDAPALVYEERRIAREDLVPTSRRLAGGLADLGVGAGDTVAVWLRNRPAWIEVQLAASALGAAVVAVNTRYRSHELEYLLADADVSVLVTESAYRGTDYLDVVASVVPAVREAGGPSLDDGSFPTLTDVVTVDGAEDYEGVLDYGAVKDRGEDGSSVGAADVADDPACLFYTSGTTSDPKGCPQTNRSLLEHSTRVGEFFDLDADDVALGALPFCGIMGHNTAFSALVHGVPLVVQGGFDAETALDLIETHGVTYFSAIGTMYERLVDAEGFAPARVETLRAGAVAFVNGLNEATFDRIEDAVGFPLVQPYGLSEGNSQIFVGDPMAPRERRRRVGGPLVFPEAEEVRVVDPETGEPVAPGEQGELRLRGVNVIDGYLGKPDVTEATFDDDGWFHTGDLGERGEDGEFFYLARLDDALRVRGFLVSPREIEAAILEHTAVEAAEVVGVDHERHGEIPVAFVIGEGVDEATVREFLDGHLADYKVPVDVHSVEKFPRTEGPHGEKVQKHRLRERAAAARE